MWRSRRAEKARAEDDAEEVLARENGKGETPRHLLEMSARAKIEGLPYRARALALVRKRLIANHEGNAAWRKGHRGRNAANHGTKVGPLPGVLEKAVAAGAKMPSVLYLARVVELPSGMRLRAHLGGFASVCARPKKKAGARR